MYATLIKQAHPTHPWLLSWNCHGNGYYTRFDRKADAISHAKTLGAVLNELTDEYIDSLKLIDRDRMVELGIEPARAEAFTDMGSEQIATDGNAVYTIDDMFHPVSMADFIRNTNAADFDYENGVFI